MGKCQKDQQEPTRRNSQWLTLEQFEQQNNGTELESIETNIYEFLLV